MYHRCHLGHVYSRNVYITTPANGGTSSTRCVRYHTCQRRHSYNEKMYSKALVYADTCALIIISVLPSQRGPSSIEICMSRFKKLGFTLWHESKMWHVYCHFCKVWQAPKCKTCVRTFVYYGTGQKGHVSNHLGTAWKLPNQTPTQKN